MLTKQQREDRKLGIGGSDMAVILGLSKYKTPYQLYLEKIGELDDEVNNQYVYWGNKLENVVREEFATRNNVTVKTPETFIHPEYSFMRGNLDGFIPEHNAVLEVKTASGFTASQWGESGSDVIPMQYLVQIAYYCLLSNADVAYLAVLIGGNDYREYKYTRNLDIETKLIEEAKAFWHCVETRTPPQLVNQIDLKLMFPAHSPDKTKETTAELKEHLKAVNDTRFKIKQLNEIEDKHKLHIMQFMQDAESLVDVDGTPLVTWKANKRGARTFLFKQQTGA